LIGSETVSVQPEVVCPYCRRSLELRISGSRRCRECRHTYPEVAGILDLRLSGDRFLDLDADRAKAERLAALADLSFPELVDAYWRMTPEVPTQLAVRYARAMVEGARRAEVWLAGPWKSHLGARVLDVGCGTGGLLVAAARAGGSVTGVDIALRWLVVARRQCDQAGVTATLVASDGAVLPFHPGSFQRVFSVNVLEHAADQRGLLHWCLLASRPGGWCRMIVANRFSAAPDPVTNLLGIGWLPRRLAPHYGRWRRNTRYEAVRPLSARALRALVGLVPGVAVGPAPLPDPLGVPSTAEKCVRRTYEELCSRAVLGASAGCFAPNLEMVARPS
jgi:ubiquinone/menaquinone biosynthesis C-methylase UbiE